MNGMEQSAKLMKENAEMKNQITKLQEEKNELTTKLLEKTEECGDLKLKMKDMEAKIQNLEETPATSLVGGKKRKMSPCNDREAVYAMMAEWSFKETGKMNYKVMHWVEKTANIPRRLRSSKTVLTPHKFMKYLDDGSMLCRLAGILGQNQINEIPTEKKKRYEYFYKFAKEEAKLAEGCIFLEDELFGKTYENYKSVFYTLWKLGNQSKEKFNKKTMWEIEHEDDKQDKINEDVEEKRDVGWIDIGY